MLCGDGSVPACYTDVTLNTAVVWCDGSGAVFDLRTPAFSFPSVSLQRNQNIRLAMLVVVPTRKFVCAPRPLTPEKAKCRIFQNFRFPLTSKIVCRLVAFPSPLRFKRQQSRKRLPARTSSLRHRPVLVRRWPS